MSSNSYPMLFWVNVDIRVRGIMECSRLPRARPIRGRGLPFVRRVAVGVCVDWSWAVVQRAVIMRRKRRWRYRVEMGDALMFPVLF